MSEKNLEGQYAGFISRLLAWLIDQGITIFIAGIVAWLVNYLATIVGLDLTQCSATAGLTRFICSATMGFLIIFAITFTPTYLIFFWTLGGMTPGKATLGLRIVRLDGQPMTFRTSFRRFVGYIMSFMGFGIGFLLILIDNRRQGWDDKFANTCVVYTWSARQNEPLIQRMTKKLFRGKKHIDHISEELRGKSIYGTDSPQQPASETVSTPDASSSDDAGTKKKEDSGQDAEASSADEKTVTKTKGLDDN